MSNVTKTINTVHKLVDPIPAANADQIGEGFDGQRTVLTAAMAASETSTGWDSYEVWRRFIKDARDRRRAST